MRVPNSALLGLCFIINVNARLQEEFSIHGNTHAGSEEAWKHSLQGMRTGPATPGALCQGDAECPTAGDSLLHKKGQNRMQGKGLTKEDDDELGSSDGKASVETESEPGASTGQDCVGDCPYCKPHEEINDGNVHNDMPLCENGEHQWACVSGGRGNRVQCPVTAPIMCAKKLCDGGLDYCCELDCSGKFGGPRLCEPAPQPTPQPTPQDKTPNGTGMVKNKVPSNWKYLRHCSFPQESGGLYDYNMRQCKGEVPPFTPSSTLAIVGGGPAGVSMARLLHDRGYKKITLYEKSERLGGKSKNFVYKGEQHDLGTCYTTGKYECIEAWADDVGLTEAVIDVPRFVTSETTPSRKAPGQMLSPPKYDTRDWWGLNLAFRLQSDEKDFMKYAAALPQRLMAAGQKYIYEWTVTMRSKDYMFPTNPDFVALNKTFLSWLKERDLTDLVPRLHISTGAQGYGQLDTMPAFYGLMWNHPNLVAGLGTHSMIKEGYEAVWQRLLIGTKVDIRLKQNIAKITRGSTTRIETASSSDEYDFLIMASPMPDSLAMLDYTEEEQMLFGSFLSHELVATIFKETNSGVLPPGYELFSWADRFNMQTDINRREFDPEKKTVSTKMTSQIDGVDGPITIRQTANIKGFKENVAGVLQISDIRKTDDALQELVTNALSDFGIQSSILHQERWPTYMPHFNLPQIVDERKPWKIWSNQGKNKTWFVGSYVSFESVADVLDYNLQLVNTHLCV